MKVYFARVLQHEILSKKHPMKNVVEILGICFAEPSANGGQPLMYRRTRIIGYWLFLS